MSWIDNNTNKDPIAKKGMRIHMINMDDQNPVDEGLEGTIVNIDDLGTMHVNWDDGRTLGVIPGIDKYNLLPASEDQIDFGVFDEGKEERILKKIKNNPLSKPIDKTFKSVQSRNNIKIESEELVGGEAEGMTIQDVAKKHKLPIGTIKKELKLGIKIEMEHTKSKVKSKEIAMDHIVEFPDYYSNEKHGVVASEKGLEKDLEETTTAGSAGPTNEPLFGRQTTIRKPKPKKLASNIITKGDLKNPLGKIYSFAPKTESKIIKVKDFISEIASTHATKLRNSDGAFDGDPWVGKKGWLRKNELAWKGGKISDILAKLNINWNDSDLSLTDKETDKINESITNLTGNEVIDALLYFYLASRLAGAKSKEVPQYIAEVGGDLMVGFVKFMKKFGYSVDTDVLKMKWDGLLKKALGKYYKEGGVLYPMIDGEKETDKINEGWLRKTKEDKIVYSILKRVKQHLPEDAKIVPSSYSKWGEGDEVSFSLPGIERNARIGVRHKFHNTGGSYAYVRVNGRDLPASKWAIKKLYYYMFEILAKREDEKNIRNIQADLTDPNFAQDVFDVLNDTDTVNEGKKDKDIHTAKWKRCFEKVSKEKGDAAAGICTDSIGYEGSIKKPHRKKDKEEIEETTTFSSVFGGGFPVTPFMFAKKGKHIPSKKPIWKGGKIVQKTDRADLLGESLLDEINKVKWVKGGKFVKFKDRCVKYNNQPHCSQGAIDNPIELSDTAFENIENISKKTGLSEDNILDRIKYKLRGVTPEQIDYNKEHGLPIWWKGSKEGFYEKMEPRKNYTGSN